jgi:hypothetical protein
MGNQLKKACSLVLVAMLLLNTVATVASASNDTEHSFDDYEINEVYVSELLELGFTEDEVQALHDVTQGLYNAESAMEIDEYLDEYYELIDGTPLATSLDSTSLYSAYGGTLELEYTGALSAIYNIIYTKVVYMPAQQVVYYQKAMNKAGFLDFLADEGISVVTSAAAAKIAVFLGVTSASLSWLIGLSIGVTVWILQNMEVWDINDAIDNSTTGKLKLEYFYMTSSSAPYYQSFKNFEPWNSSYVDVPDDYTFGFLSNVFNY